MYAIWNPNNYSVSFDCNGGTNAPSKQISTFGKSFTLTSNICKRNGYIQTGWVDQNNVSWTSSNTSNWTWKYDYDVTLNAVWKELSSNEYTVTFDCDGGTNVPDSQVATYGEKFTLTSNLLSSLL